MYFTTAQGGRLQKWRGEEGGGSLLLEILLPTPEYIFASCDGYTAIGPNS